METQLHENEVPVCLTCAGKPKRKEGVKAILFRQLHEATKRADLAIEAFSAITGDIPSYIPHPDGVQRIHNASNALSAARAELMMAHQRLNDYLDRGIVPGDLG